ARLLIETMLNVGANDGRRIFRAQTQRRAVAILKGVHLLTHNVRVFAHAAGKQLCLFENRSPNLVIVVSAEHTAGDGLDVVPHVGGRRQKISGAFNSLNQLSSVYVWR